MNQISDGIFSENVVAYLSLHEAKLFGNVLL